MESKIEEFVEKYRGCKTDEYTFKVASVLRAIKDPLVVEYLTKRFLGAKVEQKYRRLARDYFKEHSFLSRVLMEETGTHELTEALYNNDFDPEKDPLDYHIAQLPSARGTKLRLQAVQDELERIVKGMVDKKGKREIQIVNLGSGPVRDTINVATSLKGTVYGKAMRVTLVDRETHALVKGLTYAEKNRVVDSFWFENKTIDRFTRVCENEYDIALLIGILCSLNSRISIKLVESIRKCLSLGGCLIASNASKKMLTDDPFTDFLRVEITGWSLRYEDMKGLESIYRKAGLKGVLRFFTDEPWGHHVICTGFVEEA